MTKKWAVINLIILFIWFSIIVLADFSDYNLYEYSYGFGSEGDGIFNTPEIDYKAAQTFTVGNVGPNENFILKGVSLLVKKEGNPSSDLNIALYDTDSEGKPQNKLVETTTPVTSNSYVWQNITLPDYPLIAGETYAIVVWNGIGNTHNTYWWGICNCDDYSGGARYLYDTPFPDDWWFDIRGIDYKFEVYGVPIGEDSDGDMIPDSNDLCSNTQPETEVDSNGCSVVQFCEKQVLCGPFCDLADWKNNEQNEEYPRDCRTVLIHKEGKLYPYCASLTCAN